MVNLHADNNKELSVHNSNFPVCLCLKEKESYLCFMLWVSYTEYWLPLRSASLYVKLEAEAFVW